MLDYDKKFLLKSADNLTFDGSSIRGFSHQHESRPAPDVDWPASTGCRPTSSARARCSSSAHVLEPRRLAVSPPTSAARLKALTDACSRRTAPSATWRTEIEGFLFKGRDAERHYHETGKFEFVCERRLLPLAARRPAAPVHRPRRRGAARDGLREREGPPRGGAEPVRDELRATPRRSSPPTRCSSTSSSRRQVAAQHGHDRELPAQAGRPASTATGMHTNLSLAQKGKNLFYDKERRGGLSKLGLGLRRPHPQQRQRHLPDAQPERERLPPARPALRGAEPDQGLGQQPRRDGAHPHRQRAQRRASRCARWRPTPTRT